jgi:hypothetical protein
MSTTNKYFFNGVDISDLIEDGSTTVPDYVGFPKSTPCIYTTTGLDRPYNFSYSYQGTDVSNYATAYIPTLSGGTIPTTIPGAPGYSFKHISAFCWGGNGGGGGGGGQGWPNGEKGGNGGNSGTGGYAAIISYPIGTQAVNYSVGVGGSPGPGGDAANGPNGKGEPGTAGGTGGQTYINLNSPSGTTSIIHANGGNGGGGGNGGTSVNPGNSNGNGNGGTGSYTPGYTGTTTGVNSGPNYPPQPTNNTGKGGGGGSPEGSGKGSSGPGGVGGSLTVYLTYQ